MVASNANSGFGIKFKIGNGASPEVFTEMAEITEISSFGATHITADVTHMSSDGWSEHLGLGLKEGKAFSLNFNFVADSAQQISLYQTRLGTGAVHNYQIEFTDDGDTTVTFGAIVVDFDTSHAVRSKADATIQLQPSGPYTYA